MRSNNYFLGTSARLQGEHYIVARQRSPTARRRSFGGALTHTHHSLLTPWLPRPHRTRDPSQQTLSPSAAPVRWASPYLCQHVTAGINGIVSQARADVPHITLDVVRRPQDDDASPPSAQVSHSLLRAAGLRRCRTGTNCPHRVRESGFLRVRHRGCRAQGSGRAARGAFATHPSHRALV